jgi:hypothetical protein
VKGKTIPLLGGSLAALGGLLRCAHPTGCQAFRKGTWPHVVYCFWLSGLCMGSNSQQRFFNHASLDPFWNSIVLPPSRETPSKRQRTPEAPEAVRLTPLFRCSVQGCGSKEAQPIDKFGVRNDGTRLEACISCRVCNMPRRKSIRFVTRPIVIGRRRHVIY